MGYPLQLQENSFSLHFCVCVLLNIQMNIQIKRTRLQAWGKINLLLQSVISLLASSFLNGMVATIIAFFFSLVKSCFLLKCHILFGATWIMKG